MNQSSRRHFLSNVGQGMLVASVGSVLALDLGLTSKGFAEAESKSRLTFGSMEPLVEMMQATSAEKLLPMVVSKLQSGTELRTIVAAAALANARAFGGHNYDGYHTFMALAPSLQMSKELPENLRALPVLKVLHRNARFIHTAGGHEHDAMHLLDHEAASHGQVNVKALREATRQADQGKAEQTLAKLVQQSLDDAYEQLQACIDDEVDVHRVVLSWRAWETLDLTGKDQALTLLRQSVRYCVDTERQRLKNNKPEPGVRSTLTKLIDQHHLLGRKLGSRQADDGWIENCAKPFTQVTGSRPLLPSQRHWQRDSPLLTLAKPSRWLPIDWYCAILAGPKAKT